MLSYKSYDAFNKYLQVTNPEVEIRLTNGKTLHGTILGFFKGAPDSSDPYILKWQIAQRQEDKATLGVDVTGNSIGILVEHRDIVQLKFIEDNSIYVFQ